MTHEAWRMYSAETMTTASEQILSRLLDLEREMEKARRYRDKWESRCSQLQQDLEALRRTAALLEIDVDEVKQNQPSTGQLARSVRETVAELGDQEFAVQHVKKCGTEELASASTSSISRVLIRMHRDNELELVKRGQGKRPSLYRVTGEAEGGGGDHDDERTDKGPNVTLLRRIEGGL